VALCSGAPRQVVEGKSRLRFRRTQFLSQSFSAALQWRVPQTDGIVRSVIIARVSVPGLLLVVFACCLVSCTKPEDAARGHATPGQAVQPGQVTYVEIPVTNMERAMKFYGAVLDVSFERRSVDGYDMAAFVTTPASGSPAAAVALAKGDVYVPAKSGPLIYLATRDIDSVLRKANANGGQTLFPKKEVANGIVVAEFEDSEGNRIGIQSTEP
jgi:uncharacterized protein